MENSAIDLFCGIGGLSYGLKKAGINVVAGLDFDASCKEIYESNMKADFLHKDIAKCSGEALTRKYWNNPNTIRILAGCAPCQPFSAHANKNKNRESNEKWDLLNEFKRLIGETEPQIITMENVPNLSKQEIFQDFVKFLHDHRYFVSFSNVYCPDYGIPQNRRRLVLLASKFGSISLISKTHSRDQYHTLRDAISHLPVVRAGEICESDPLHRTAGLSELGLERIIASKPNGTWLDWNEDLLLECHKRNSGKTYKSVYGRLSWDEPSSTITTQFYNIGTGRFGHPSQNRALTLREAAILQTFPEKYVFYKRKQDISLKKLGVFIGNAVPVDLGYVIGRSILTHVEGNYERCNW